MKNNQNPLDTNLSSVKMILFSATVICFITGFLLVNHFVPITIDITSESVNLVNTNYTQGTIYVHNSNNDVSNILIEPQITEETQDDNIFDIFSSFFQEETSSNDDNENNISIDTSTLNEVAYNKDITITLKDNSSKTLKNVRCYDENYTHPLRDQPQKGVDKSLSSVLYSNEYTINSQLNEGNSVVLTLCDDIQSICLDKLNNSKELCGDFGNYYKGAIVVMDSKTGAILGFASSNNYQINDFCLYNEYNIINIDNANVDLLSYYANSNNNAYNKYCNKIMFITQTGEDTYKETSLPESSITDYKTYAEENNLLEVSNQDCFLINIFGSQDNCYSNYCTTPTTPGSTMKIISAVGIVDSGNNTDYTDIGTLRFDEGYINNHDYINHPDRYPVVDTFNSAMVNSYNCYFATKSLETGYNKIFKAYNELSLGFEIQLDFTNLTNYITLNNKNDDYGLARISYGQGCYQSDGDRRIAISPLQMAMITNCITSKNYVMAYMYDKVISPDDKIISQTEPIVATQFGINSNTSDIVKEAMRQTANKEQQFINLQNTYGVTVYGKSGTAESEYQNIDYNWYTSSVIANDGTPLYTITTFIQSQAGYHPSMSNLSAEIYDYLLSR